ncbi:MAG: EVE domain-containing protein [Bradymonadaceae bacterium]
MQYWLMKSEPDVFSLDDLKGRESEPWSGVRNYEARNLMRDQMKVGDQILFYHSNARPSGVVGVAEVASEPYADPTQFDESSGYHDPKATKEEPRWVLVDVRYVSHLPRLVSLKEIKANSNLEEMVLVKRSRLSVTPVLKNEFDEVLRMAEEPS